MLRHLSRLRLAILLFPLLLVAGDGRWKILLCGLRCGLLLRVAGDGRSCAVSPAFYTELRRPVFSPVLFFAPLAAECTDRLLLSCEARSREYTQLVWSKSGKIAPQPIEGSIPVLHISGMLPACFISLSSMSGTRELHLVLVVSKTRNQLDSVFMFRARSIFDRHFLLDFSFVLWYHNSWESICDRNLLWGYCTYREGSKKVNGNFS